MDPKLLVDGWEYRQYEPFVPATTSKKWAQNLDPKVIWHDAAGVFGHESVLYNFATKETTKPVMLWLADPFTTSLEYEHQLDEHGVPDRFDAVRKYDGDGNVVKARKGYEVKLQTLPLNSISWGCRSSGGVSNYCGPLVLQVEDMAYSRDMGNLTEDELHFRGVALKEWGLAIMRFMDADWVPQPYINVGLPFPRSKGRKNGQRLKRKQLKRTNLGGANVLQHSIMPWPNDHGDCGAKNLGVICEIARHELNQRVPASEPAPPPVPQVRPKVDVIPSVAYTLNTDGQAAMTEVSMVRPQQRGQAAHHIELAERELGIAKKLLTPKPKKEKKK